MDEQVKIPPGIANEDLWRKHCRQIFAGAMDLPEGRRGVIETASAMISLAHWTKAEGEPEFLLFLAIEPETDDLPLVQLGRAGQQAYSNVKPFVFRKQRSHGVIKHDRDQRMGLTLEIRYHPRFLSQSIR